MPDTLGIDDDMVSLAALPVGNDVVDDLLLVIVILLGKQDILRTVGDTAPQRYIARVPSHNLDDAAALMGGRSISDLVDGFHRRIDRRIKTDRVLRAGDIQIDRTRNAYRIDSVPCQCLRAAVGTVTADYDQTVNPVLMADLRTFQLSFLRAEL